MKPPGRGLLLVLALIAAAGCASTQPPTGRNVFAFEHNGETYEIISTVGSEGVGGNFLIRREGSRILVSARDHDQDGTLDTLLVGDMPLARANAIYTAGISAARAQGKSVSRLPSRTFRVTMHGGLYAVQTFMIDMHSWYNKFTMIEPGSAHEVVLIDANADGILDRIETGTITTGVAQPLYQRVLQEGIRDGRVEQLDGRYRIQPM
jgi:hypothetical protein